MATARREEGGLELAELSLVSLFRRAYAYHQQLSRPGSLGTDC